MALSLDVLLIFILFIYAIVISILYWIEHRNISNIIKQKEETLKVREIELSRRDNMVVDKEICFRELTKLKTIQNSALDILKSYDQKIDQKT